MKKFAKLLLATTLAVTALAGAGCSSADKTATTQPKEDQTAIQKSVYAAALMAEDKFQGLFGPQEGLENGKSVSYMVSKKSKDEVVQFLSSLSWDKEVATKELDAVLGDKAVVDKANAAFEAKAKADKKDFKPVAVVANDKLGKNVLTGAKFEDVKISEKDGKYTLEYKGLKYTLAKSDSTYKVVGKEGQLQK